MLERSKKSGGRKRRKPRLKDADRTERYLYRAAARTVDAADLGLRRYDKARKRSARRRRDGALTELLPNMAEGMTAAGGRLALVPFDLFRAGWTASARRAARRTVSGSARALRRS